MKLFVLFALFSLTSFASDINKRPPAFAYSSGKAVFVDFTNASYKITYDMKNKLATAEAQINFNSAEAGFPIFDSHAEPTSVIVDGKAASQELINTPSNETKLRIIKTSVSPGAHVMTISLPITQLVEFSNDNVKSAFWMSDLSDRGYLERYLPTNMMFDRIPTQFFVKFVGAKEKQKVYANGDIEVINDSEVKISFRSELNANCIYFHTVPESAVQENLFSYKSIDGRNIPAVVYMMKSGTDLTAQLEARKNDIIRITNELELDYGAFLHPSITVYIAGSGGMEYSGATMTSVGALGHELFHSYFARGMLHANGNSGWIDEALASWRDYGYRSTTNLLGTTTMASKPLYNRVTDRNAYGFGEEFMSYLDNKVKTKGGLKPFLRDLIEKQSFKPLTTEEFIGFMDEFYGMSFTADFKKYVYGKNNETNNLKFKVKENKIHKQMSLEELKNYL